MGRLPSYNVVPDATGRAGAAYYAGAARIMAESADRESQILASQSAVAMQTIGALSQSLSAGFDRWLQYDLAVKQQSFDREVQMRKFQAVEDEMNLRRVEMEDAHLQREQDRQIKSMDLARRQREYAMEPQIRAARAGLVGLVSEIQAAATAIENGSADKKHFDTMVAADGLMGEKLKAMAAAGAPQAELEAFRAQIAPLVKKAATVTYSDGTPIARGIYRKNLARPNGATGQLAFLEYLNGISDPEGDETGALVLSALADKRYTNAESSNAAVAAFAAAHDLKDPNDPQYKQAVSIVNSVRMMDPEARARLRVYARIKGDPDGRALVDQKRAASPNITWTTLESALFPEPAAAAGNDPVKTSPTGWTPGITGPAAKRIDQALVMETLEGDRTLPTGAAGKAWAMGFSTFDLHTDPVAQHVAGIFTDERAAQAAEVLGGPLTFKGALVTGFLGFPVEPTSFRDVGYMRDRVTATLKKEGPPAEGVSRSRAVDGMKLVLAHIDAAQNGGDAHARVLRAAGELQAFSEAYKANYGQPPVGLVLPKTMAPQLTSLYTRFISEGYDQAALDLATLVNGSLSPKSAPLIMIRPPASTLPANDPVLGPRPVNPVPGVGYPAPAAAAAPSPLTRANP